MNTKASGKILGDKICIQTIKLYADTPLLSAYNAIKYVQIAKEIYAYI